MQMDIKGFARFTVKVLFAMAAIGIAGALVSKFSPTIGAFITDPAKALGLKA